MRDGARARRAGRDRVGPAAREAPAPGWDLLLVCVAGLLLTSVARVHLLVPALGAARPTLLFGTAAICLYLINYHPMRRPGALRSAVAFCVAGLLGWTLAGVPFALNQAQSVIFLFDHYLKAIVIFLVVAGSVRGLEDVERLAMVYFAGAFLYAGMVLVRFETGGADWRLTALYTYDPNDFATFAVTALPLGVYLLVRAGGLAGRLATGVGLIVLSIAFVWSGSRGGFLALVGVGLYLLFRYRAAPLPWRLLGVGLVCTAVLVAAAGPFWERMATLLHPEQDYNVTSVQGRVQVWKRGLGYLWDRPVFGVGLHNFGVAEGTISPLAYLKEYGIGVLWSPPHNSFLQVAVELGLPGLALFLGILGALLADLRKIAARRPSGDLPRHRAPALAAALIASMIGFMIGGFFLSLAYSDMLYVLVGLGLGLRKVTMPGPRRGAGVRPPARRLQRPGAPGGRFVADPGVRP